MSIPGASRPVDPAFAPALREVAERLALPIPARARLVQEMEADLADLVARLVDRGVPEADARERARATLLPDEASLERLQRLHRPLYRRLTDHVAGDRLRILERGALLLIAAGVTGVGAIALLRVDVVGDPSPFLVPVLVLGALALAAALGKAFQLWVKGDHAHPARGLPAIPLLSLGALAVAIQGAVLGLFRLASRLEAGGADGTELVTRWLLRDTTLLSVALLVALAGGVAWFILAQWVVLLEDRRRTLTSPPLTSPFPPSTKER